MMEPGRLCAKIAGRDAGKRCVIVDVLDERFVMIDGETRRRKCNMKHLEPLDEMLDIKKGASHDAVIAEFKKLGVDLKETKPRKAKPRPKQTRAAERKKMAPKVEKKKGAVKAEKKETAPAGEKPETKLEKAISAEDKTEQE